MSGLPDVYIQSLRAVSTRAEGIATYQAGLKYLCYKFMHNTLP